MSADPELRSTSLHESGWARGGAAGEQQLAKVLAEHLAASAVALHDRRIPRSPAKIDHIVIAPSGVWVIGAERHQGRIAITRPLLGKAKLTIAGRDRTKLIDALAGQVALVKGVTSAWTVAAEVPVHGVLCFVSAELPLFGKLSFDGYALLPPKSLAKRINATQPELDDAQVRALAAEFAQRFPPA